MCYIELIFLYVVIYLFRNPFSKKIIQSTINFCDKHSNTETTVSENFKENLCLFCCFSIWISTCGFICKFFPYELFGSNILTNLCDFIVTSFIVCCFMPVWRFKEKISDNLKLKIRNKINYLLQKIKKIS